LIAGFLVAVIFSIYPSTLNRDEERGVSLRAHSMLSTINSCVLLLSMALSGCGTISKPNTPFAEPIDELNYIEKKNPLLAMEIRKLPDILDGLNNDERKALQRLSEIYAAQTSDFESAFAEMYKIGLPEHRKYCSPLQALLWIAMESSFSKEKNPIKPYALSNLLDEAWIFYPRFSPQLVEEIVATIRDPEIRKDFEKDITEKYKHLDYRLRTRIEYFPELFPDWVLQKLKELKSNSPWGDYNEVLARLNSPALVDFYVKKQINYSNYWEIPGYSGNIGNPHYVFKYKKGDCLYTSAFIVEALRRNGYSAWIEKMPPLRSVDSFHAVCVLEIQGEKYIIDDGKEGYKRGIMKYDEY
jgi:hypothetical protein